jgi:hypothetical protein
MLIIDDFLKYPEREREKAIRSDDFKSYTHNEIKYRGIALVNDQRNLHRIENYLGCQFKEWIIYYRRYLENEANETYIHSDVLIGTYTSILYLNPDPPKNHGTAFWMHTKTGLDFHEPHPSRDDFFWRNIYEDGFDEKKWQMTEFVEGKFNRLLCFFSPRYHSRYPMKAWGDSPDTGRLIKVFFGKI